jgi:chromosome segregation ATPase
MSQTPKNNGSEIEYTNADEINDFEQVLQNLQLRNKELQEKNEALSKDYKKRERDLEVLDEIVKERTSNLEELRSEKETLKETISELKSSVQKYQEEEESHQKRIESLQAEKKALKNSIEKIKTEVDHANNLIEKKESEIKLLADQIESKQKSKDDLNHHIEQLHLEMNKAEERKKEIMNEIQEFRKSLIPKKENVLSTEVYINDFIQSLDSLQEQKLNRANFLKMNGQLLTQLQSYIEFMQKLQSEKEHEIQDLEKQFDNLDAEFAKLKEIKDFYTNWKLMNLNILDRIADFNVLENSEKKSE